MPDKNFCSSLCLEACDMGKISSGTALCLAILTVLVVEFEVVVHNGNQNWCFVTENLKFWQKLPYQDPCDKLPFRQVAL
jgi:hypothetical protein